ncbi:MAG: ATPase domain-containing protein [Candidatus Woesearchaeota archaeon]
MAIKKKKEANKNKTGSNKHKSNVERVKTNIPGFDRLVDGGLVKDSIVLLSGGPGTGKTIFGMQFLYNGATELDENGMFISFEENLHSLKEDAKVFGWDFDELEKKDKVRFITFKPFSNPGLTDEIIKLIKGKNIKRAVIDSISLYTMAFKDDLFKIRKELYRLTNLFENLNCTTILTSEVAGEAPLDISSGNTITRDGMIEFIADAVITLHNSGIGGEADRAIRVLKMRRTNHEKAPIPMTISEDGMNVLK